MIAYKELKDILKITVGWEQEIKDLYDVAELGLESRDSQKLIATLKAKHLNNLQVLKNIKVEDYGQTEWVKFASKYKDEELLPKRKLTRQSTPAEVFSVILEYEEKVREFYTSIARLLVTEKQKELFESLVKFKEVQIQSIQNLMKHQAAG